ncbi:MAG: hypothetical protein ACLUKN_01935 [Bacilli bacterium]
MAHPTIDEVTKAGVLIEALPYIQRFHGSTFVVKYGGAFMDDPNPNFARWWRRILRFWPQWESM